MAILNLQYYQGKDYYSDGEIENQLLELAEKGVEIDDIKAEECSYPILYHFSPERENILNWFPFKKECRILEVGAGCGAITGMLCEKAEKVVCIELSKRRSTINYNRHRQNNNLEIIVGNFNDIELDEKFDYVILNGVFEYAIGFTDDADPYVTFLKRMNAFLENDGEILLAIENRLGLKYFSGAPEDHVDSYGMGLNEYPSNPSVRTFSKTELIDVMKKSGLEYYRFYYPYPDYKYPNEIFTDESIVINEYGKDYYSFTENRAILFDESKVASSLVKERVADVFSNSFLVEISKQKLDEKNFISYVKINSDRKKDYKIATKIQYCNGNKNVIKYPITRAAESHIKNMHTNEMLNNKQNILVGELVDNSVSYPYVEQITLYDMLKKDFENHLSKGIIIEKIAQFFDYFFYATKTVKDFYTDDFKNVFGERCLPDGEYECIENVNIDAIFSNVFVVNNTFTLVDNEWIFGFAIPVQFIKWRILNDFAYHLDMSNGIKINDSFFREFGIDFNLVAVFKDWNRHFTMEYVGANQMEKFAKGKIKISVDDIVLQHYKYNHICCSIYIDYGKGFSEENKVYQDIRLKNNVFCVDFEIPNWENAIKVRFDPIENCPCKIEIKCQASAVNHSWDKDGIDYFLNNDPQYIFETVGKVIHIEGKFWPLDMNEAEELYGILKNDVNDKDWQIKELTSQNEYLQNETKNLCNEKDLIQRENSDLKIMVENLKNRKAYKILNKFGILSI